MAEQSDPAHEAPAMPVEASHPFDVVVVAASYGGLHALRTVIGGLSAPPGAPVLLVQHRAPGGPNVLAGVLQRCTSLPVEDAIEGETPQAGHIYVAPSGAHLVLDDGAFAFDRSGPLEHVDSAVDPLLRSAAAHFGSRVLAVILTGRGHDGAAGIATVAGAGGRVIVQDPASAEAPGMPRAALAAVPDATVHPLDHIASAILALTGSL